MYSNRLRHFSSISKGLADSDVLDRPCRCLGSRIADQMYSGVDSQNSTLITGQYDDDDNWDVDPACDMRTDRFDVELSEQLPTTGSPSPESGAE